MAHGRPGPSAARVRLTSGPDEATGVQLIREFRLDAKSSHLACTQIIKNISQETSIGHTGAARSRCMAASAWCR